jgi:uncharacterized LabA/DUF88 family protein
MRHPWWAGAAAGVRVRRLAPGVLPSHAVGVAGLRFLHVYWYDGVLEPQHADSSEQRRVFDGIAFTPGVQLRLGHLAERRTNRFQRPVELAMRSAATDLVINADALLAVFNRHWTWRPERRQKGVDTLITLDLVRLAQCGAFHTAVLVAGDRDLAEPVRTQRRTPGAGWWWPPSEGRHR